MRGFLADSKFEHDCGGEFGGHDVDLPGRIVEDGLVLARGWKATAIEAGKVQGVVVQMMVLTLPA